MTRACILVQALSGRGKTFWAAMGGKPIYLAPESKCRLTVKAINPEANVVHLDTLVDFGRALRLVTDPQLVEKGYTRIVLDSYSELTELMPEWLQLGFPLQIQDYGTIGNKAMDLVRALLKSPVPVIIISRSEAKEQGKIHRIVPGSLGKSAGSLPAKCILTAETRYDENLGWVVDTNPDEYTQRAGLPWVPTIYQGSADAYLAAVEAGPAPTIATITTADRIAAAGKAADSMKAERLVVKPEPKTPGEVIAQIPKSAPTVEPISPEVAAFVDAIADGPTVFCPMEDCTEITDLVGRYMPALIGNMANYLHHHRYMPDPKDWTRIVQEGHDRLLPSLSTEQGRRALSSHLLQQFAKTIPPKTA